MLGRRAPFCLPARRAQRARWEPRRAHPNPSYTSTQFSTPPFSPSSMPRFRCHRRTQTFVSSTSPVAGHASYFSTSSAQAERFQPRSWKGNVGIIRSKRASHVATDARSDHTHAVMQADRQSHRTQTSKGRTHRALSGQGASFQLLQGRQHRN